MALVLRACVPDVDERDIDEPNIDEPGDSGMNIRIVGAAALSLCLAIAFAQAGNRAHAAPAKAKKAVAAAAPVVPITISSSVPGELNAAGGGAPQANLSQAAAFAWQEFIALNWPAIKQTGASGQRDTPDPGCKFGDPKCTGPLVWETFRGKVEIFPGQGTPPGYPGASGDPSLGYDALPTYNYANAVPACDAASTSTAWVNLDETDQITLDSMYAGIGPTTSATNSAPQLIRFLAKGNRAEYAYVAQNKWWTSIDPGVRSATKTYLATNQSSPPPGSAQYVSLPNNTIEAKAGWRVLTSSEQTSGRFHTAKVRFYESKSGAPCYREETWGLVALHIIQKTASAPYFIYATFEQADNILSAGGTPVEDENGAIKGTLPGCRADQTAPCPTTPSVTLQDTATVNPDTGVPPQVNLVPATAAYCTASVGSPPKNQLYYQNSQLPALPSGGFICINYRDNLIPATIVQANQTAHASITTYNKQQGIANSPWLYYKLINVQYQAIDKNYAGVYQTNDPASGHNPASYHLANIVVETNRSLQLFSGGLVQSGFTGANSDYDSQFGGSGTAIHKNIYYNKGQLNMGGCMGCHGSQGQHQQGDFSVILANGAVRLPEVPSEATAKGQSRIARNRVLK